MKNTGAFNLITDAWIPILPTSGSPREVGLLEALERAHEFRGLALAHPLEHMAVLRLLLAILYRVLTPGRDLADLQRLYREGRLPADAIVTYLNEHRERFALEGDTPFLQVPDVETTPTAITVLTADLPQGGWPLLTGRPDSDPPPLSPAQAARTLLAHQTFAVGGLLNRNGVTSVLDAPSARFAQFHAVGETLARTLLLNLAGPSEPADLPFWERPQPTAADVEAYRTRVQPFGPATTYTYLSRAVRLIPTSGGRYAQVHYAAGWRYESLPNDPMLAWTEHRTQGRVPHRLDPEREAAFDLLAALPVGEGARYPSTLRHALALTGGLPRYVAVGALLTDPKRPAKVLGHRLERLRTSAIPGEATLALLEAAEETAEAARKVVFHVLHEAHPRWSNGQVAARYRTLNPLAPYWNAVFEAYTAGSGDAPDVLAAALRRVEEALAVPYANRPSILAPLANRLRALVRNPKEVSHA